MDIPDFEELEWLESHTAEDQFDDDDFGQAIEPPSPPSSPELDEPPQRPTLSLPPKLSPFKSRSEISHTVNKRVRSDLLKSVGVSDIANDVSRGKRTRYEEWEDRNVELATPDSVDLDPVLLNDGKSVEVDAMDVLFNASAVTMGNDEGGEDSESMLRLSPGRGAEVEMETVEEDIEERILSRFATEIEGDCVPVTGLDGERVYAKLCRIEMDEDKRRNKLSVRGEFNGLLKEPVQVLMQKIEQEEFTKVLQASVDGPPQAVPSKVPMTNEQLWVDKYAPSSFTELLSDEQTNREVLLWLKQWDSCVFGSEIKSTTDDVLSSLRRHTSGSQHSKQFKKSYHGNNETRFTKFKLGANDELNKENNISQSIQGISEKRQKSSGPPEQRILLLCGPPGLGKTTLAHVAARHCGYRVVEINASDDRSLSTVEARIIDVVQMNSVIADSKPKCLVIDEIDGALGDGKGAVDVILKLASAERKADSGKENISQGANPGRKSSQEKRRISLLRPVICICNDLYAPALRPLRHVAKIHIFAQPTVSRVVNRLKYICNKEGVRTSSIALSALAEYTECDIRSSLNTLQFLHKKNEILNVLEVSSQVVGRKDVSKSAFDIWKEIFQKRKEKQARKCNNSSSIMPTGFEFLYSMISNRGDYDLILDGIHENILQLRYVDPMMQKTVQCLDNLLISDITHRYIMGTQKMSLQVYQPPIAILIHGLIAQIEKKEIEWPKSFQRHRTMLAERLDMFHTWHSRLSPHISRHLSVKSLMEDSISPMLHILSPPTLRPVALHLLSDSEKNDLGLLVNNMVSYSITYKNIKSDRSAKLSHEDALHATTLSLDPPLADFIHFKGHHSSHFDLALAVKQVLVHEVEKQKILQSSFSKSTHLHTKENNVLEKNDSKSGLLSKSSYTRPNAKRSGNYASNLPVAESGNSSAVNLKSVGKTKRPSGDLTSFFNRTRKVGDEGSQNPNNTVQKPGKLQRESHPLLFKFNEGFTNAIKRPVRMWEFLQ